MSQITDSQKWMILIGAAITAFALYLLAPILTPFFAAALLAYLGDPLADQLEKKFSRTLSVSIVFTALFSVLTIVAIIVFPLLAQQVSYLINNMPTYIDHIQHNVVPMLAQKSGIDTSLIDFELIKKLFTAHYAQAGGLVSQLVSSVAASGLVLVAWIANMVLIPVVTFYLLRDWDVLMARIDELLPRKIQPVISKLAKESDEVLAAFLRGQFLVMLALGIVYSTGLWFIDLKLALLIGMLAGLVSFVPYLGFIVGIVAASVAMLLQTQDLMQLIPVAIVFTIGQMLEGMLLTPLMVGDRIGLHPVAVIFAVLAGGQLFGFVGILLALPVAAVLAVLIRHVHDEYKSSAIFNNAAE